MLSVLEKHLIELAKHFEGIHLVNGSIVYPYHDPVGYPTIGYGKLLSKIAYENLSKYPSMTFPECDEMLIYELKKAMSYAIELSPVLKEEVNLYRLVAITDFCFNCGQGNYKISTLRKCINSKEFERASEEILKWNKAAGRVLKGLTLRREAESKFIKMEYKGE